MRNPVVLKVRAHPAYLALIRDATARFCRICRIDDELADSIKLAVDEACSNVIKHAYHGDTSGSIVVKYSATDRNFRVIIEDSGEKARPELIRGRDLDDVRPGGLGIHFIRRIFDSVEFDAGKRIGNRMILQRKLGE